jgi:ribonuclease Y
MKSIGRKNRMTDTVMILLGGVIALVIGVLLGKFIVSKRLELIGTSLETDENVNTILKSSDDKRQYILNEAQKAAFERYQIEEKKLNLERENEEKSQHSFSIKLERKDAQINIEENKTNAHFQVLNDKKNDVLKLSQSLSQVKNHLETTKNTMKQKLEKAYASEKIPEIKKELEKDILDSEKLEISRWSLEQTELIKKLAQKKAQQLLENVYFRYKSNFIWPKTNFNVPVESEKTFKKYFQENEKTLNFFTELLPELTLTPHEHEESFSLKIAGGWGVDKEILKHVLEDALKASNFDNKYLQKLHDKYKNQVHNFILNIGKKAAELLNLKDSVHPEILKLIGSLNFRTSHRQNQYYHSIEVATFAGMIAEELGINKDIAIRSGLLHDIGKSIDYRIEKGHAVISGECAEQYGESQDIIDPVLAHHDDKIVETPYAYVLKAADAMSGARPGARVDMEEGYNRRIDGISVAVSSFKDEGVTGSAIMHAGREIHVYVNNQKIKESQIQPLAKKIVKKLEGEVEYPGQIKVTVIRRMEASEVA